MFYHGPSRRNEERHVAGLKDRTCYIIESKKKESTLSFHRIYMRSDKDAEKVVSPDVGRSIE